MKSENKIKMSLPDTITGWVLLIFGTLALLGGLMGIIGIATFTLTSISAFNNGILHFIGVFKRWSLFPYYAMISRTFMGIGLLWMLFLGNETSNFIGGAVFEFGGVLVLIISLLLDVRKKRKKEYTARES